MAQQFDVMQSLFGFGPADVQRQIGAEQEQTAMGLASGVPGGLGPAAFQAFRAQERARGTPLFSSQEDTRLTEARTMQEARQAAQPAFEQGGLVGYLNQYAIELEKRGLVDKAVQARSVAAQKEQEAMKTGADVMFKTAQAQKMLSDAAGGGAGAEIKTVNLGDRVEFYRKGETRPFKTEQVGETPSTQFRRELQDVRAAGDESKKQIAAENAIRNGTRVLDRVKEAKELVGPFTTGFAGTFAVLPSSDARKLANKIKTIKANLGFNELQQMRDASPTGGALGQVAVQEIEFLQSTIDALDQLESSEDLLSAFKNIEIHYQNWLDAVNGRNPSRTPVRPGESTTPQAAGQPQAQPQMQAQPQAQGQQPRPTKRYNPQTGKLENI
jgi:hypothetical protein